MNLTSEAMGIDSESNLFIRLSEYKDKMPNLISRRQYNDRRKTTSTLCDTIRKRIAEKIDGGEEYFCIDSKPIEVCRVARGNVVKWAETIIVKLHHSDIVPLRRIITMDINYTLFAV